MATSTSAPRLHAAAASAGSLPPAAQADAQADAQANVQAQLALNELFPHLRAASDAALRDIFVSLRLPARPQANA